ncbi:MAG: hypothetical protein HOP09_15350 [Hyphomicrobium sp.]|nr:hypothetical protein [Hyphomicrobium sp.]
MDDFFADLLTQRGWESVKKKSDGVVARHPLNVGYASLLLRVFPSSKTLALEASIGAGNANWDRIASKINGDRKTKEFALRYDTLVKKVDGHEISSEHVLPFLDECLKHAAAIDIDAEIDKYSANRPDFPFIPQIFHLAALAYLGQDRIISGYLDAFRRGKNMNFVPAITEAFIARAYDLALTQKEEVVVIPKLKVGDVFRVPLSTGVAHIQYIGKGKLFNSVVLVGPRISDSVEVVSPELFKGAYFIHYHVDAAIRAGLLSRVGQLPAPLLPLRWRRPLGGAEVNWSVDDTSGREVHKSELTQEEIDLPVGISLNHAMLLTFIEHGWRPEKFIKSRLSAFESPPDEPLIPLPGAVS